MPIPLHDPHNATGVTLKRLPLRKAAVLFIAVVCLSLCGLLYLQLEQSRRHDLALAQVASSNLTRAMAQQAEDTFMQADLVLTSLADWIQADGFGAPQKPRLQKTFARRVQALNQLHGIFLFDQKGQWVVTSFEDLPRGPGVADREYFKFHQQNVSSLAHIGPAIRSRENGEWIIPISKRVNDKNGNFQGVLLAGIKMAYFDQFFKSFSIDDNGSMFLGVDRRNAAGATAVCGIADWHVTGQERDLSRNCCPTRPPATRCSARWSMVLCGCMATVSSTLIRWSCLPPRPGIRFSRIGTTRRFAPAVIVALVVLGVGLFGWVFLHQVRVGERVEADLRKAKEALKLIATHDSLTGLANRRLFEGALDIEFGRGARQSSSLSLIMLDIDYFKRYNDAYGHVAGDHCLAEVARAVKGCCHRKADLAVRYGGEEFAVLLPDTDIHGAMVIAEQIRRSVMDKNIIHSGSPTGFVTVSLGCYSFVPTGRDSMEVFIERADAALYQAKHSGRNRSAVLSMEGGVEALMRSDR